MPSEIQNPNFPTLANTWTQTQTFSNPVIATTVGSTSTNSIRFDAVDGGRILFYPNNVLAGYCSTGLFNFSDLYMGQLHAGKTITAGGTTGNQTINQPCGSVNFAATATALTVTNSLVTANSVIMVTIGTNDATMNSVNAVAGSGSFVINANAAATAETRVNFLVIN